MKLQRTIIEYRYWRDFAKQYSKEEPTFVYCWTQGSDIVEVYPYGAFSYRPEPGTIYLRKIVDDFNGTTITPEEIGQVLERHDSNEFGAFDTDEEGNYEDCDYYEPPEVWQ